MNWVSFFIHALTGLKPMLPQFILIMALVIVFVSPLPGKGPRLLQERDTWRLFKYGSRDLVMSRAGHRCEGTTFLAWGRCQEAAVEADHVYPHARRGPTVPSNGQALCRGHNRRKGAMRPPWWYVLSLEHRRRSYFPEGADVRVVARIPNSEIRAHATTPGKKRPR